MTLVTVTGATGFVGRAAVRELVDAGARVRALVRGPSAASRVARAVGVDVECVEGDMLDPDAVDRAVAGARAVVHLAAPVSPEDWGDEAAVDRGARQAAVLVAERAKSAGCATFVFTSSIAAMGFWSGTATPESPCAPVSSYGRAKLAAEKEILRLASDATAFDAVVLRPPTVYGPGERYNFLSLTRAVERGLFRIIGSGQNVMPLCTVENLARVIREAAFGRAPRGVHMVADDAHYTMVRIQRALCLALGRRVPRVHIPLPVAKAIGLANDLASRFGAPSVLSRARVRTLTVDQRFDLSSLGAARGVLDAPLETAVAATVDAYRSDGLLAPP